MGIKHKLSNFKRNQGPYHYASARRHKPIKKNWFLLEAMHGSGVSGQIYYLLPEIQNVAPGSKIFIVSQNPKQDEAFLKKRGYTHFSIVEHLSVKYYDLLATCEFLINDTTFYPFFNKRKEQKYFIIWHGTPLKKMGKDTQPIADLANVQRNFYMANQVILSNEYSKDVMAHACNLNAIYAGMMIVGPMPRNSVFYSHKLREEVRDKLDLGNKKVLCYMPTWRGHIGGVSDAQHIETMLMYLNRRLDDDTILFVKLHYLVRQQLKMNFEKIKYVPENYEIYEFLTATDGLITDYSSVMYDYLNMDKPVFLYAYDLEHYTNERGLYHSPAQYPFTLVKSLEALNTAIQQMDNQVSYQELKAEMVAHDNSNGAQELVQYMINGKTSKNINEYKVANNKDNMAIYSDEQDKYSLLKHLNRFNDVTQNVIYFFDKRVYTDAEYEALLQLPKGMMIYSTLGDINGNIVDRLVKKKSILKRLAQRRMTQLYNEEFDRLFGDVPLDWLVYYMNETDQVSEMVKYYKGQTAVWLSDDIVQNNRLKWEQLSKVDRIVVNHSDIRDLLPTKLQKKVELVDAFFS
ncbi:CDP-glycerol glycerophosphotransferase family protein [Staphylococcus sp. SQ8-PEA]|uniref:CDP-glycerol glycerophosphotransferase family protein n=1 Tax=Staphylococcus marylandisciuri TaxID=2981529 RepID=A0ABT2QQQ6_9STAP|nr:CDP-glycerol glycerophosphotransferase family protein [Staphylococcus marylandisciuri]MCU5746310.1 CDP-glycerol glycerophosphotransferase family protein [Staphylococcus marylandisciuri]